MACSKAGWPIPKSARLAIISFTESMLEQQYRGFYQRRNLSAESRWQARAVVNGERALLVLAGALEAANVQS